MKKLSILFTILLLAYNASAQEAEGQLNIFNEAETAYNIGRLETAESLLTQNLNTFRGTLRQSVYRLLALTCIGQDKEEEAEKYVQLLLGENPYYSTIMEDPQRFIDMVDRIKAGMGATITTASSQAESLNEAPVPVTLITEEMIRISGARNLKELLIAYVPSMSNVDCNDDINIAMRSVYSSGQEKILFMLNGHRLNSYSTNISSPDFSLSLEKVKQIEVLRGPASSLYGGVALTGVVNIITKQGADVDGINMKAGIGSYGTLRGDVLFGKRYFDLDVFVWGSIYKADGQDYYVPASDTGLKLKGGNVVVGGVGKTPSYDVGVTLNWNGISLMYDTHFSQIRSPYTMTYTFSPYNYDEYISFRGHRPGFATRSHHANISYGKTLGNLYLNGSLTYDDNDMTHYNVVSDEPVEHISSFLGTNPELDETIASFTGVYRYHDGQEKTFGALIKGDYSYINNDNHKGLFSFGAQFSKFELIDSRYLLGYGYEYRIMDSEEVSRIAKGKEHSFDAYTQLKHTWGNFIFNAGLRYDYKQRFTKKRIHEFSPRLAFIYLQPNWNVKLSYSRAFVDAPYFYRKTNMVVSQAEAMTELKSEKMNSFQLTLQGTNLVPGLTLELNGFFNHATNVIYPNGFLHLNAGTGKTIGTEFSAEYHNNRFTAHLAMNAIKILSAEYFDRKIDRMYNVPDISASTVLGWQATKNLKLHTHLTFMGNQTSYKVDMTTGTLDDVNVNARLLMDAGANYSLGPIELSLNVYNLFNKHYRQGGLGTELIQQPGRWFLADIAYKF